MTQRLHTPLLALFLSLASAFVGSSTLCHAQDGDPRHPEWVELPLTQVWWNDSLRRGEITHADFTGAGPLGDIDHSGTDDFVVSVRLTAKDSSGASVQHDELWLYRGIQNALPDLRSYQRIGPTELYSNTKLLAGGDWDGDGDRDLCVNIQLPGDTTVGPTNGYEIHRVVIFWNNGTGVFSVSDTTRLPNPVGLGNDVWGGGYGWSVDFSGDHIDDLLIRGGGAFVNGSWQLTPAMHLFHGVGGGQWGRKGVSAKPAWGWWNVPIHNRVNILDQNCDGRPDLVFYNDSPWPDDADLIVCYGSEITDVQGIPDTLSIEEFFFNDLCGRGTFALLSDITSDHIPDLILTCEDEYFRVYAGLPGKRLSEVYGTGNDPADPENGFADARPWAKVEMPGLVGSEFNSPIRGPLFDLGDADLDGWNDVWTHWGDLVVYRAGLKFDKLIDAHAYFGGELMGVALLGDIDGTGLPTRALLNGYVAGENVLQFLKSSTDLPTVGYPRTPPSGHLPDRPTGNRCSGIGAVNGESPATEAVSALGLRVLPNPSSGQVRVVWGSGAGDRGSGQIAVHDPSGKVLYQQAIAAGTHELVWNAEGVAAGVYYITVTIGDQAETITIVIE